MKTSILPTMALALQVDWLDAYGQPSIVPAWLYRTWRPDDRREHRANAKAVDQE